jgi:hypothetical protein
MCRYCTQGGFLLFYTYMQPAFTLQAGGTRALARTAADSGATARAPAKVLWQEPVLCLHKEASIHGDKVSYNSTMNKSILACPTRLMCCNGLCRGDRCEVTPHQPHQHQRGP